MVSLRLRDNPMNLSEAPISNLFMNRPYKTPHCQTLCLGQQQLQFGPPSELGAVSTRYKQPDGATAQDIVMARQYARDNGEEKIHFYPALFTHYPDTGIEVTRQILESLDLGTVRMNQGKIFYQCQEWGHTFAVKQGFMVSFERKLYATTTPRLLNVGAPVSIETLMYKMECQTDERYQEIKSSAFGLWRDAVKASGHHMSVSTG